MKKLIIMLICFVLLCSMIVFASDTSTELDLLKLRNSKNLDESLNNLFILNNSNESSNKFQELYDPKINYKITYVNENEAFANLKLEGYLKIKNIKYPFSTAGEVQKIMVDDTTYLIGPLEGTISINDVNYELILGLSSNGKNDNITFNIKTDSDYACLIFGKPVITDEVDKKIKLKKVNKTNEITSHDLSTETILSNESQELTQSVSSTSGRTFNLIKSATGYINHSNFSSQKGVTAHFYDQPDDYMCMIMIQSYKDTFEQALKNYDTFSQSAKVYKLKGSLNVGNGKGAVTGTHPGVSQSGPSVSLLDVFNDVIGMTELVNPLPLISTIISAGKGGLSIDSSNMFPYIEVIAGYDVSIYCDNFDDYLPLFFSYQTNTSSVFAGSFTGEMQYEETYSVPLGGQVYIYYNSNPATSTFSIAK